MVKKVGGKPPKPGIKTDSVQSAKTVGSNKVDKVRATKGKESSQKVEAASRRISSENHEQLLQLIEEEADKLFNETGLPAEKKETIKNAVKMALEASMAQDEDAAE